MIGRRSSAIVAAAALLAAGCGSQLGRNTPSCDESVITNAIIISAQSVAGTAYVPCVQELKPGWDYEHLEARRGQTRFWLSSDRVGQRFLEVTLEPSCPLDPDRLTASDEDAIPLYVEETEADFFVEIIVVPEGDEPELRDYAAEVVDQIGSERFGERLVRAYLDATDSPTARRIETALAAGHAALVVGPREVEEGTVEMHRIGRGGAEDVRPGLDPMEAVEEVAEGLGPPVYRATWRYPFEGGCVTYRFNARGIGAERIRYEVMDALGFLDLGPLRRLGEQFGYVVP